MTAPGTRRLAHRPSRRGVILEAGLGEFIGARYLEVNMSGVARRAGMSTSSVYYHFSSKDELWVELHGVATQSLTEAITTAGTADDLARTAKRLVGAFIDWMRDEPLYSVFYSTYAGGNSAIEAARRSDAVAVTRAIATLLSPTAATGSPDSDIKVRFWVAAVTLEVLFRELCLAVNAGHLDHGSVRAAGDDLAAKVIGITTTD